MAHIISRRAQWAFHLARWLVVIGATIVPTLIAVGAKTAGTVASVTQRYRVRHSSSGAKSDPGDAKVLAGLVRIDRHDHQPAEPDIDPGRRGQGAGPRAPVDDLEPAPPG
jgi:hypothetical protein